MRIKRCGIFAQVSAKVKVFVFLRKEKVLIFCSKRLARASPPPPVRLPIHRPVPRALRTPMKVKPAGRVAADFWKCNFS